MARRAHRDGIVWIEDGAATVITFDLVSSATQLVTGSPARRALWRLARADGVSGSDDVELFAALAAAVGPVEHVVVAGPDAATAASFIAFVGIHHPELVGVVAGPEQMQSSTTPALLAYGRARLLGNIGGRRPGGPIAAAQR